MTTPAEQVVAGACLAAIPLWLLLEWGAMPLARLAGWVWGWAKYKRD